jgi:hypothetical protein
MPFSSAPMSKSLTGPTSPKRKPKGFFMQMSPVANDALSGSSSTCPPIPCPSPLQGQEQWMNLQALNYRKTTPY